MKRVALSLLVGLAVAAFASGCGTTPYFPGGPNTNAVLNGNNYRVVATSVQASDSGFRVFGLGADPHLSTVMEQIRAQAQLDNRPRALVNVTFDHSVFNFGWIVKIDEFRVSCDVVEYIAPAGGGGN